MVVTMSFVVDICKALKKYGTVRGIFSAKPCTRPRFFISLHKPLTLYNTGIEYGEQTH